MRTTILIDIKDTELVIYNKHGHYIYGSIPNETRPDFNLLYVKHKCDAP